MADYLPSPDAAFNNWQINFVNYLQNHPNNLDLDDEELAKLLAAQSQWETAYEGHLNAQSVAQSACQAKEDSRKAWEQEIRSQVRKLQSSDKVTNADRAALGITVPSDSRSSAGVPSSRPIVIVAESKPLSHTLHFFDENTPNRRAKPTGVMGAEVWVKVSDTPPKGSDDLQFLGLDTRTPYVSAFEDEDAGKTAYYRLRWVNRKGDQGPWSDVVSASILG